MTGLALAPMLDQADGEERYAGRLQRDIDDEASDDSRLDRAAGAVVTPMQIDQWQTCARDYAHCR
jgi:hypothetical protein